MGKGRADGGNSGRPTKFEDKYVDIVFGLCVKGFTDADIAEVLGVHWRTIQEWRKSQPAFRKACKEGKAIADQRVERSLYERANGYTHDEEVIFQHQGEVIRAETRKHYPPDTAAAFIWLKNRKPEQWTDRREITFKDYVHDENREKSTDELMKEAHEILHELTDRGAITPAAVRN